MGEKDDVRWQRWFTKPLRTVTSDIDSGFLALVYSSALFERAARIKLGTAASENLGSDEGFLDLLKRAVTDLQDMEDQAPENFWGLVRNGLVHDLAASKRDYKGVMLSRLTIDHDQDCVTRYDGDSLHVSPAQYAEAVIKYVEDELTVDRFVKGNSDTGVLELPAIVPATDTELSSLETALTESQGRGGC